MILYNETEIDGKTTIIEVGAPKNIEKFAKLYLDEEQKRLEQRPRQKVNRVDDTTLETICWMTVKDKEDNTDNILFKSKWYLS